MVEIVRLQKADAKSLKEVNALLRQLSGQIPPCTLELLSNIIDNSSFELWVAKEGGIIIGIGELAIVLKPEGVIAQIEDVVVDEGYRGKGLGKEIGEKLIERARTQSARMIQLSSNPARTAANALYQKLGFTLHETNAYRLKL